MKTSYIFILVMTLGLLMFSLRKKVETRNILASNHGNKTSETLNKIINENDDNNIVLHISGGGWTILNNITFPKNISLEIEPDSFFISPSPEETRTITINGQIYAKRHQIFDNVKVTGSLQADEIYPEWWGAKRDGIHDDTKAIETALMLGNQIVSLGKGTYAVSEGIDIASNTTLKGCGMGLTTLKRFPFRDSRKHQIIRAGNQLENPRTNIYVQDLTINCNGMEGVTNSIMPKTIGAIWMGGTGNRISRVRALNFGPGSDDKECFVVGLGCYTHTGEEKPNIIEECELSDWIHPRHHGGNGLTLFTADHGTLKSINPDDKISDHPLSIIRNCSVYNLQNKTNAYVNCFFAPIVHDNTVSGCKNTTTLCAISLDWGSHDSLQVRNNRFEGVYYGIRILAHKPEWDTYIRQVEIHDNYFSLVEEKKKTNVFVNVYAATSYETEVIGTLLVYRNTIRTHGSKQPFFLAWFMCSDASILGNAVLYDNICDSTALNVEILGNQDIKTRITCRNNVTFNGRIIGISSADQSQPSSSTP